MLPPDEQRYPEPTVPPQMLALAPVPFFLDGEHFSPIVHE